MNVSPHVFVSLILGAALHAGGALFWPALVPLRIFGFILLLSGYLGLLSLLGLDRPLNRLSAVLAGYAAMGNLGWLLIEPASEGFGFLYVLCLFGAFFVTSVAGLHRKGALRSAGLVGAAASVVPLLALVAGHVALGGFGLLGLGWGMEAAGGNGFSTWPADLLLAAWAVVAGLFLMRMQAI